MKDDSTGPVAARLSLREWACLRTELIWIYQGKPAARSRHATYDHRETNWAWRLERGEVVVSSGGRSWRARAGQWLMLPVAVTRQDFSDDAVLVSVRFQCQWPSGENLFEPDRDGRGVVLDERRHPGLRVATERLLRDARRMSPGDHREQALQDVEYPVFLRRQAHFLEWLAAWYAARIEAGATPSRRDGGDIRAYRVARVLNEAPLAEGFPLARVTAEAGLSAVQVNRIYRQAFGFTPHKHWERRRLETAKLRLETEVAPLKRLAAELGFGSAAHFVVWFSQRAGMTPGAWRERRRGTM
jgi:AraC-type DNA-binding domain-containing proteins